RVTLQQLFARFHAGASRSTHFSSKTMLSEVSAAQFPSGNAPAGAPLLTFRAEMLWWEPRYSLFEQKVASGSPATHFLSKNMLAGAVFLPFCFVGGWSVDL
ncbi:MAG: hypothetical protein ACTTJL_09385, partial [Hoylesella enoeca]|uniref:hypothetical protein n=1 Tax=Hoylesella enoeca TaxID=76123 RepID=UPI003F9EF0DD